MPPNLRLVLPILVAAGSLGLLASSIYVPSIPDMGRALNAPIGQVQLTMTVFLVAYGVSMLIMGGLSDRFGRRRVLLAGNTLCLVASLACAAANSIEVLLVGRVFQAIGSCAGIVIARAMVRDLFDREHTARAMSTVAMAVSIVPIMAPALGGYLHVWLGWRANFVVVALFAIVIFFLIAKWLPETNVQLQNQVSLFRSLSNSISVLLRARSFIAYAMVAGCGGAAYYAFASAAPVIFIDGFHVSADIYGLVAAISSIGFVTGSFLSGRFSLRAGPDRLIRIGGWLQLAAGMFIIGTSLAGVADPWTMAFALYFMGSANGLFMPNAFAGSVSAFPQLAGAAAGVAGFIQMSGAGLATVLMASSSLHTALPMGLVIAGAGLTITLLFRRLIRN
jgi:DHA1 family bicyclomycin/chloramphenicol resistance-like MFS transporter